MHLWLCNLKMSSFNDHFASSLIASLIASLINRDGCAQKYSTKLNIPDCQHISSLRYFDARSLLVVSAVLAIIVIPPSQ